MGYTLQAVISENSVQEIAESSGLEEVRLPCGLYLIPFPYDFVDSNNIPFLPLTDEGKENIDGNLLELCLLLSKKGKAAYVEAEFFGGQGTQGCALFESGVTVGSAKENESAINYALKWLGVNSSDSKDEFEIAGLGIQRNTEGWL